MSISTGGGGGYGDPFARPTESVQADVIDGYISLENARELYGVALDPETLAIDEVETAKKRSAVSYQLSAQKLKIGTQRNGQDGAPKSPSPTSPLSITSASEQS